MAVWQLGQFMFPSSMLPILLLQLLLSVPVPSHGHNITHILAQHPEFSIFNHYLTATHLAGEINYRQTITLLAIDNPTMSDLLASHGGQLSAYSLKNILSLHVLVDYFSAKKLHQLIGGAALSSTLFQASGASGFVNISVHRSGRVLFSAAEPVAARPAAFVRSVEEFPHNISIIQISSVLSSPAAEAPTAAPSKANLTEVMARKGCKTFAGLLVATADAEQTFEGNVDGGLTMFCPTDQAMQAFMPKFKNLTADGKLSLLLYHGVPVYYSMQMLQSNNGVMNTLATDGMVKNYNFTVQNDGQDVTLKTPATVARITGTLLDEDPLALYSIDAVLEPSELFKPAEAPAPAKESPVAADSPKPPTNGNHAVAPAGPDVQPDDEKVSDGSGSKRIRNGATAAVLAAAATLLIAA